MKAAIDSVENDNNDLMVSVIVITYNQERFIEDALDSIINQETSFKYEILVGDDCSSDGTYDKALSYQERYPDKIKVVRNEVNQGVTKNSFNLLNMAQGKYIANCEGDDYWIDNQKLAMQVDFLESHPEYIACTHDTIMVDELKNPLYEKIPWISDKEIFTIDDYRFNVLPGHSSSIVRRNIFLDKTKDYSFLWKASRTIGDRQNIMLFLSKGDFYRIDKPMSCYRKHNISHDNITFLNYSKDTYFEEEVQYTINLIQLSRKLGKKIQYEDYVSNLFDVSIKNYYARKTIKNLHTCLNIFTKTHCIMYLLKKNILKMD